MTDEQPPDDDRAVDDRDDGAADARPDEELLASVYLDGEATPDERALVETSTTALAEVQRLGDLRDVLSATAPIAPVSAREADLAAALGTWERMSDLERSGDATPGEGVAAAAAVRRADPSGAHSRRRSARRLGGLSNQQWLGAAAAGLVTVLGAGVILNNAIDGNDDGTTAGDATEPAATEPSQLSALEAAEAAEVAGENVGDDIAVDEESAADVADEVAGPGLFPEEAEQLGATAAPGSAPGAEQPAPARDQDVPVIATEDDLAIYASLAVPSIEAGPLFEDDVDLEPEFNTCEADLGLEGRLEPVIYDDVFVLVGVDLDSSVAVAYEPETCTVVERVSLPADTDN
jgi:hypothetical protein